MAEIKRANYFTSQFLEEEDFNDEQAYHLSSRRRHNRVLHTSGVVDGLDVTFVIDRQIQVSAGAANDTDGREIVLADSQVYTLATVGTGVDLDVYLTIAHREVPDPADQDTQGLGKFTRMTERPLLQDSATVPPTDGSVIVLARIHLNGAGAIVSNGIDTTVRTLGSAKVTPNAINTPQLADGAVNLAKLANEVKPLSVLSATGTAITAVTNTTLRRRTIGETHSARGDNPHGTTAAQIDNQGGANRLVTQINAGTGVITRSHVERAIASGVVTFENVPFSSEVFSDEIDAGFGPGAVSVKFALDDVPASVGSSQVTAGSDTGYGRTIMFRTEVDRATGRFRIFATRTASGTGQVKVRWFASRPTARPDASVAISVTVTPSTASVTSNQTQGFTAKVNNANIGGVAWSLMPPVPPNGVGPGTLSNITPTSVTYTPPGITGTYTIVATNFEPNKTASANIAVNADPLVTVTPASPTVLGGATQSLSATVVNTANTGVTWSIREGTGNGNGTLSVSGNNATYTAPATPGSYHVDAASVVNSTKIGTASIIVPPPTISVTPTSANVIGGTTLNVGAIVGNTNATGVTWSASGGTVSPTTGNNATYTAPTTPGSYTVTAHSTADSTKTATCAITVPAVAISIQADANPIETSSSTTLTAVITGTNDHRATWVGSASGSVSPTLGNTTIFFAPSVASIYTVTATSVANPTKSVTINMDVQDPKAIQEGGKVIADNVDTSSFVSTSDQLLSPTEQTDTSAEARSFVRPKKRSAPKLPRKPK